MSKFAAYGFNKSHSAAYGLVTYQTGYLKYHYPEEFMAGLLTCDKEDTDKVVKNVAEARAMGIEVERPDVNLSESDFSVLDVVAADPAVAGNGNKKAAPGSPPKSKKPKIERKHIRFGLSAVKGVGENAVVAILDARASGGPFSDLFDLASRVDLRRVNKKVFEALTKSGAFDDLHPEHNRASLLAAVESAVEEGQRTARDRESGQGSLFGLLGGGAATQQKAARYPAVEDWSAKEKLQYEKESLGFFMSGHPIDRYVQDLKRFRALRTVDVQEKDEWEEVQVGGVVTDYREMPLKSGDGRMAFFALEDQYGQVRVACFAKAFALHEQTLKSDEPIVVVGKVKVARAGMGKDDDQGGEDQPKVKELTLSDAVLLSKMRTERTKQMLIDLPADATTTERLDQLKTALEKSPGPVATVLRLRVPLRSYTDCQLPASFNVTPSDELLTRIERLFGQEAARLR